MRRASIARMKLPLSAAAAHVSFCASFVGQALPPPEAVVPTNADEKTSKGGVFRLDLPGVRGLKRLPSAPGAR